MTIDNSAHVEGLQNPDNTPMTRGDLVNLQATDLHAIRDQVTAAIEQYDRGEITPPQMADAALVFARHLAGYTHIVSAKLAEHDQKALYAAPMPTTITIPDVLPDDFS